MSRIAYVNGRYIPHRAASVHIEDRGYQFADGVYEVVPVHDGRLVEEGPHLDRLHYSLGELRIAWPVARYGAQGGLPVKSEWPRTLGEIRTRLDPFSDDEQKYLINWGYANADAALRGEMKWTGPNPAWPFSSHTLG
jgi:hypothetical protein